jgi:hypothetical protein
MKYTFELNEETHEVPGKYCVCPECEGTGYTLCDSMKGHAYTQEEFDEAFDDEAKEQYFTRGGIYDQPCKTCKGKNVVMVANVAACNEEQKKLLKEKEKSDQDDAQYEAMCRMERMMGA